MHIASSTLVASFATAMGTLVTGNVGQLWTVLLVVASIPLTFIILGKIVSLVKKTAK